MRNRQARLPRRGAAMSGEPHSRAQARQPANTWLNQRERGALLGMRVLFWIATALGRGPARQLVRVIAFYYAAVDRVSRGASRVWLERVHARRVSFREVYAHVLCFARVTLDRVFLLQR